MKRFATAFLFLLLLAPLPTLAQETSSGVVPALFFLHHTEEQSLGVLALAPLFSAEDENGDYFERWLAAYAPIIDDGSTTASTSAATSTPFSHTYAYSKLGNIASTTTKGAYAYAETDYANPHAPTSINGNTLSYDENGNLTSYLSTTYTWDYQNRLTKTASTTNTFFDYDHTTQRVAPPTVFSIGPMPRP